MSLAAGASYVVSYHTAVGRYVSTQNFHGASTYPAYLTVPTQDAGVYAYGATSAFPTSSWLSSQYWVDVTFTPADSASAAPATELYPAPAADASPTAAPPPTIASSSPASSSSPTASASPTASSLPTTTSASPTTTSSPTPTPTPTTTTSATAPSPLLDCVSLPSRCGYPDSTNTGITDTAAMLRVPQDITSGPGWSWDWRGWLDVRTDGATVENLIVSGPIEVYGTNVTIRNNRLLVTGDTWAIGLRHTVNAVVANNDIGVPGATRLGVAIKDIYRDTTGRRSCATTSSTSAPASSWAKASSRATTSTTWGSNPGTTSTA